MAVGTITYVTGIEGVSRKFALRHEIAGKNIACFIGGMVRKSNKVGVGIIAKNFMFVRKNAISVSPSETQLQMRGYLSRTSKAVAYITKDLAQITSIQELFKAGKADFSKKMSGVSVYGNDFRGWVWKVTYARVVNDPTITDQALKQFPTTWDA